MKHASLFSGIGGFDLAAEWLGWKNVFHCEINPFCRKILNHYWPDSITYENIKTTDFKFWRGRIDVLTGGFPCQPYSAAGKRRGKEDERHLWPEMLRAIREIKPRWIVGENVAGLLTWNGGLVFKELCADLENEGYEVQAFVIPACAVGAPHRRDRVWIIAYADSGTNVGNARKNAGKEEKKRVQKRHKIRVIAQPNSLWTTSHTNVFRLWREINRFRKSRQPYKASATNYWQNFPTQSPVCGGDDGLPTKLDGITLPKWRNESIKGYGNAVVPQVVYQIFKAIEYISKNSQKQP